MSKQATPAANAAPGPTVPNQASASPKPDVKSGSALAGEVADRAAVPFGDRRASSFVPPNAAAGLDGQVARRPAAEGAVGAATAPVGAARLSRSKPGLHVAPADSGEVLKSQDAVPLSVAVAATPGVQGNALAIVQRANTQDLPDEISLTMNTAPTAMKVGRPATSGQSGKEMPAKSGPAADGGFASGSAKHETVAVAAPFRTPSEAGASSVSPSRVAAGSFANAEAASPVASALHGNQPVSVGAVPQAFTPNHAALSSARGDMLLGPMDVPDATGIRGIHVLASGPAQLDVGVLDGTHGWLRIRAELGAGGAVDASLTAGALAHDSLKAALPEMAKYLGSEAVNVNSLAVHRFAAGPNTAGMATGQQQSGDASGHRPRGEGAKEDGGTQGHRPGENDRAAAGPALTIASRMDDSDSVVTVSRDGSIRGSSRGTAGQAWSFGVLEGSHGGWLNVCA